MDPKKLRDFAPEKSFERLPAEEKIAALHRGFVVLLLRGRRQADAIARLQKRVELVERARRKKAS